MDGTTVAAGWRLAGDYSNGGAWGDSGAELLPQITRKRRGSERIIFSTIRSTPASLGI
jgi:hypothetical protein